MRPSKLEQIDLLERKLKIAIDYLKKIMTEAVAKKSGLAQEALKKINEEKT